MKSLPGMRQQGGAPVFPYNKLGKPARVRARRGLVLPRLPTPNPERDDAMTDINLLPATHLTALLVEDILASYPLNPGRGI